MKAPLVFDANHYSALNEARGAVVIDLIAHLRTNKTLESVIDVGCGLGYFSKLLQAQDFTVRAVDGRAENVAEATRRYPGIQFQQFNAEDPNLIGLGLFDLCFCFGLLYHLENPFLAARHLKALTKSLLLIEGVIFPGDDPVMALIDEEPLQDQGLQHVAFYPSEACLAKMFYRVGFSYVYGLVTQPSHPEYHESADRRRIRTILAASFQPIDSAKLYLLPEPASKIRPWNPARFDGDETLHKLRRFANRPLSEKIATLKRVVKPKQQ